jgi:hypothetical protein
MRLGWSPDHFSAAKVTPAGIEPTALGLGGPSRSNSEVMSTGRGNRTHRLTLMRGVAIHRLPGVAWHLGFEPSGYGVGARSPPSGVPRKRDSWESNPVRPGSQPGDGASRTLPLEGPPGRNRTYRQPGSRPSLVVHTQRVEAPTGGIEPTAAEGRTLGTGSTGVGVIRDLRFELRLNGT